MRLNIWKLSTLLHYSRLKWKNNEKECHSTCSSTAGLVLASAPAHLRKNWGMEPARRLVMFGISELILRRYTNKPEVKQVVMLDFTRVECDDIELGGDCFVLV